LIYRLAEGSTSLHNRVDHGIDMSRSFDERDSHTIISRDGASAAGGRIASVDALRGLTILLMIFVNDLGKGAPSWMHHIQPPNADGMTLADVVFPAFLFIVGVSIPLAFERALEAGRSKAAQLGHVLVRTAALLVMGVIVLNGGISGKRQYGGHGVGSQSCGFGRR
jgi:hypothetical protein